MGKQLGVLALILGAMVGVAAPAQAQASAGPWVQISAGEYHTCAINTGRSLYCWGYDSSGQVGDGEARSTTDPVLSLHRVGAPGVWSKVAAGEDHTCAITTGKNLYCWGYDGYGQIGDHQATGTPHVSLYRVGAAGVWVSVTAGGNHTCGITTGKNLYCWGKDTYGQVGDGTDSNPLGAQLSLFRVGGAGVWGSVAAGGDHTCGITTGKNLYCWGYNEFGQVGDGTTNTPRLSLIRVGGAGVWGSVAAGVNHTCGITTGKNLYCWGADGYGQVGDGTQTSHRLALFRVGAAGVWAATAAGHNHTCGVTTAKNLYCWGYDGYGQIGDHVTSNHRFMYRVGGTGVWRVPTTGYDHTCGITSASNLYCWGFNEDGEVGDGTTDSPRLSLYRVP